MHENCGCCAAGSVISVVILELPAICNNISTSICAGVALFRSEHAALEQAVGVAGVLTSCLSTLAGGKP